MNEILNISGNSDEKADRILEMPRIGRLSSRLADVKFCGTPCIKQTYKKVIKFAKLQNLLFQLFKANF